MSYVSVSAFLTSIARRLAFFLELFSGKGRSIVIQISVVMLICILFLDKIL